MTLTLNINGTSQIASFSEDTTIEEIATKYGINTNKTIHFDGLAINDRSKKLRDLSPNTSGTLSVIVKTNNA